MARATTLLRDYEVNITKKVRTEGYGGDEAKNQWDFSGALLYSVTVITTIGKRVQSSPSPKYY